MNIEGISVSQKTQVYFWAVCVSISLFTVVSNLVYGFKDRLYDWLWANRRHLKDERNQPLLASRKRSAVLDIGKRRRMTFCGGR